MIDIEKADKEWFYRDRLSWTAVPMPGFRILPKYFLPVLLVSTEGEKRILAYADSMFWGKLKTLLGLYK